ncbi:MAG: aldehyde ferredoxin oxidoreductase C-terminal domain-containing protein, partial [Candidatus Fermentibacteria bacterium]
MDTISAGATLACFSEITGEKLNAARITGLLLDIAAGRGEGRELGQGSLRFARSKGRPELSMSVKGMELPGYDPRGAYGMALGYVTATRGACHLRAYPISHEILRKPVATDRFSFAGKARIVKIAEDMNAVIDSLTACKFFFFGCSLEEYASAYSAVTAFETSAQDLLAAGERIYFRERMMNAKCGFNSSDDVLPSRFFREAGSSGDGIEIPPLCREEFLEVRSKYYRVRGLDSKGTPLSSKAGELDLEDLL